MILPNFPIPDKTYDLIWAARKRDETVSEAIVRAVGIAFGPKPQPTTGSFFERVQVIDNPQEARS